MKEKKMGKNRTILAECPLCKSKYFWGSEEGGPKDLMCDTCLVKLVIKNPKALRKVV